MKSYQMYKEGQLMQLVGQYSSKLDKGAPNLFNNKEMIRNSINQLKFQKQRATPNNFSRINESMIHDQNSKLNHSVNVSDLRERMNKTQLINNMRSPNEPKNLRVFNQTSVGSNKINIQDPDRNQDLQAGRPSVQQSYRSNKFVLKSERSGSNDAVTNYLNNTQHSMRMNVFPGSQSNQGDDQIISGGRNIVTKYSPRNTNPFKQYQLTDSQLNSMNVSVDMTINSLKQGTQGFNATTFTLNRNRYTATAGGSQGYSRTGRSNQNYTSQERKAFNNTQQTGGFGGDDKRSMLNASLIQHAANTQNSTTLRNSMVLSSNGDRKQNNVRIAEFLTRQRGFDMTPTLESRSAYLRNKNQRPSQLIAPLDYADQQRAHQRFEFEKVQTEDLSRTVNNFKLMKNQQTHEHIEPTTNNKRAKSTQRVDIITSNVLKRPETMSNYKKRYITDFYERERSAHHSPDFEKKVQSFPNLFSKTKSEFSKISNAIPQTSLILRSNIFSKGLK
eukprot:403371749